MLTSEKLISQGEESYVGVIAQGIIEGWAWPVWYFQVQPHHGGSLVNALIAVPIFLLFGPYMIALKVSAILFYLITMFLLFMLLEKYFNLRIALIACLLYIFSPPLFTARTLIFNGSIAETVFFSSVILFIFFNLIFNDSGIRKYFFLGIVSGISLWYSYVNILIIITYTASWFIKDRIFFLRKRYAVYLLSFMIALIPWFAFNRAFNFMGLEIAMNNFSNLGNLSLFYFVKKVYALIFLYGYKIFMFDNFLPFGVGNILNVIYYFIFTVSFLYVLSRILKVFVFFHLLCRGGKSFIKSESLDNMFIKEFAIAAYPIIFILFFGSTIHNYDNTGYGIIDYRYALLLFPFIFIIIALFIDGLYSVRNILVSFAGKAVLVILLIMGVIGNVAFINSQDFTNRWLFASACNYELVGMVAARRYGSNINYVKAMFRKVNNNFLQDAYRGYGIELAKRGAGIDDLAVYAQLAISVDAGQFKNEYLYGVGYGIIDSHVNNKQLFQQCLIRVENSGINKMDGNRIIFGMLERALAHEHIFMTLSDALEIIPLKYHVPVYIFYTVNNFRRGPPKNYSSICNCADKVYERYCYMGLGAGISSFYFGDKKKILSFFGKYGIDKYSFLIDGVGVYFYRVNNLNKEALVANLPPEWLDQRDNFLKQANIFDRLLNLSDQ